MRRNNNFRQDQDRAASFDAGRGYSNSDRERFMGRDDHRQMQDHGHGGYEHRGPYGQGSYGASSSSNQYSRSQGQPMAGYEGRDSFSNGSYTRHDEQRGQQGSNNERSWGGQYARDHNDRDWSRAPQHGSSSYGHQQQQYGGQQYGNAYAGRGPLIDERGYAAAYYGDDRQPLDDESEFGSSGASGSRSFADDRGYGPPSRGGYGTSNGARQHGYTLDMPMVHNERGTWSSDVGDRSRSSYGPQRGGRSYGEDRGGYGSSRGLDDRHREPSRFRGDNDRGSFAHNGDFDGSRGGSYGGNNTWGASRSSHDEDRDNGRFVTSNDEGSGSYRALNRDHDEYGRFTSSSSSMSPDRGGFHGSSNRDLPHHERERHERQRFTSTEDDRGTWGSARSVNDHGEPLRRGSSRSVIH